MCSPKCNHSIPAEDKPGHKKATLLIADRLGISEEAIAPLENKKEENQTS